MIQVQVPRRTFMPVTEPIEFSFDAPTWSLGKSMAAHITMGRIGEVYHNDLKDTIYQICGRRDEQWEMISTRKDRSIAAFIQELNQHIRRQENQMCADMIDLKKAKTRIMEQEEELKATREDYMEEIVALVEKNGDLTNKLEVLIGGRLHNIRSSFVFVIIITTVGVGVGVVDDDVVLGILAIDFTNASHGDVGCHALS